MKSPRVWMTAFAGCMLALAAGCATKSNLPVYHPGQTGTAMTVQRGTVVSVRDVIIKPDTSSNRGVGGGARMGSAVVTDAITGGIGGTARVIGDVVGGTLGGKLDEKLGEEVVIEVEGGRTIVVVQERAPYEPPLSPGERVRIQTGGTTGPTGIGAILSGGIYGGGGNTRVIRESNFEAETARPTRIAGIVNRR